MKHIVLLNFNSIEDGINFMSSYQYPSHFTINNNWKKWYNKDGVLIENIEDQNLNNIIFKTTSDERFNSIIGLNEPCLNGNFCYDGNFIYLQK